MPTGARKAKKPREIQEQASEEYPQPHWASFSGHKPAEKTGLERFMYLADIALSRTHGKKH